MFHSISPKRIEFVSNPPLDPIPHVVRDINEYGSPVNKFVLVQRDNQSPFKGSHFDPAKHSLRAMLNLGIQLTPVNYGQISNDINAMYQTAKSESQLLIDAAAHRRVQAEALADQSSIVEPQINE